jgi:PAS domain S-box-containing protein
MASLMPAYDEGRGGGPRRNGLLDVLLVEDNPGDVDLIREMLLQVSASFTLQPVQRLASAIDELRAHAYAAVLLDLGLPDSNGLTTLTRLLDGAPRQPVVVTTGFDDEDIALQAVRMGAQDYIVKGHFDGPLLSRTLRYAIERERAERALRESAEQFHQLFHAGPSPMWVLEPTGLDVLACNREAVETFGWSADELTGQSVDRLVPEGHRPAFAQSLRRVLEQGAGSRLGESEPCVQLTRDGQRRETQLGVCPLPYDGRPALLMVASDVTEQRRLQAQLLQASKMEAIGQLASGVAHDFNNVLSVIRGYAELLGAEEASSPATARRVGQVLAAVDQGAGLTRQLLAFSREQALEPVELELDALLDEMSDVLRRLIGRRVDIVHRRGASATRVIADPVQLQQVLMNLAINARDAMPEGGTLTVETAVVQVEEAVVKRWREAVPGPHVLIRVADSGEGMSAETLEHIFEPFFTTKDRGKGTGLGLATVYGIVKQSGGFIDVRSEPGAGTAFDVYLPQAPRPPEPEGKPSGE